MKKAINNPGYFWSGIIVALLLLISYFVKFRANSGSNFDTYDSLLGMIIFHNPFVLAIYLLIVVVLIAKGFGKK